MELRKDLQLLAIWYIPVAILSVATSLWYSDLVKETILSEGITPGTIAISLSYIPVAIKIAVNLVVAIWLFYMVRKTSGNKYIWFLFGLIAHLLAVTIYVGLLIYEQLASNKSSNLTGAKNAPSS